jgi:hypothetical protein
MTNSQKSVSILQTQSHALYANVEAIAGSKNRLYEPLENQR